MLETLLQGLGSNPLWIYLSLTFCGIPIPVPEDVMVMTVGWSMTTGSLPWPVVVGAVYLGVLSRDSICFFAGRSFGARLLRVFGEERVERSRAWIQREGRRTLFSARFVPALRIPVFAVAGATGMSARDFYLVNAPTILLTMTLQLGLGYTVGPRAIAIWQESPAFRVGLVSVALLFVVVMVVRARRRPETPTP